MRGPPATSVLSATPTAGHDGSPDRAWISCRLSTSTALSRSARMACTMAAVAVRVVTSKHAVLRGALADRPVVVERLASRAAC